MDGIVIAEPARADMVAGAELLATALGFAGADAIPAWLMVATAEAGGVVLGAYHGPRLAGWSYAFPAWDGAEPSLYACGLAVAPGYRSLGIGLALKLGQRDRARERGYRLIRWTADPLAAPALRLYLSGLGARMTGYRAGLFDGLRAGQGVPQDDVEVVWRLDGDGEPPAEAVARVEIPRDRSALGPAAHLAWRLRVRERFGELLGAGRVGTAVERDAEGRCWVVFG